MLASTTVSCEEAACWLCGAESRCCSKGGHAACTLPVSICPCGSAFCISVNGACGIRVWGRETAGAILLWLEAGGAVGDMGIELWIMAVFMMSLGRGSIGGAAGEEGGGACTDGFAGSRGAA